MNKISSTPSRTAQYEAHMAVAMACRKGVMEPAKGMACVDCGRPAVHYDHRDYSKPLEVEPVCGKCNSLRGPANGHVLDSPRGRPPKPADQQTKPYSIRLTEAEIVKLKAIGMDRLRAWLRRISSTKEQA